MAHSIYTVRVQGADGRITPASFRASSLEAAEAMALARGYDVIVSGDDAGEEATATAVDGDEARVGEEITAAAVDGDDAHAGDAREEPPAVGESGEAPATGEHDTTFRAASSAPWPPLAWIAPLAVVAIATGLIPVLPSAVAPRLVVCVAVLLLLIVAAVIAIAALVAGRREGRPAAIAHGGAGLALSVLLLLGTTVGVLVPLISLARSPD